MLRRYLTERKAYEKVVDGTGAKAILLAPGTMYLIDKGSGVLLVSAQHMLLSIWGRPCPTLRVLTSLQQQRFMVQVGSGVGSGPCRGWLV